MSHMQQSGRSARSKRVSTLAAWAGVVIVACVGVSYLTTNLLIRTQTSWEHDQAHGHQWLHRELALTESEIAGIDKFEPGYRSERDALLSEFSRRISALREMLASNDRFSSDVNVAIHRIHEVHGKLQELSIRHYYDMMSVLPEDKQERLRQLAVEALSEPE